jgi:hypothetical protein
LIANKQLPPPGSRPFWLEAAEDISGIADCNERRNITAGQKAMAHAILFPDPKKTYRGKKALPKSKALGVESERYAAKLVSQARTVLRHTPELAEKVRDGFALSEAYEAAMTGRFIMASTSASTRSPSASALRIISTICAAS